MSKLLSLLSTKARNRNIAAFGRGWFETGGWRTIRNENRAGLPEANTIVLTCKNARGSARMSSTIYRHTERQTHTHDHV